jgi:hypothetical protein
MAASHLAFLNAYDSARVIMELSHRLAPPSGMAWIWWGVRTSFANPAKIKQRMAKLQDLPSHLGHYVAAARARQRRRASITCQVMSAGIPRPISRARQTRDKAKAPSPGMPSKLPTKR